MTSSLERTTLAALLAAPLLLQPAHAQDAAPRDGLHDFDFVIGH